MTIGAEYVETFRRKRRVEARQHLGGKCVQCGATTELDFHHIDPATKMFTISLGLQRSRAEFFAEVDKCELRCHACHVDHHRSKAPCGTPQRYWRGCRCSPCVQANSQYHKDRRERYPSQA